MGTSSALAQVGALAILLAAVAGADAVKPGLFVFGDSYGDTGNRNRTDPLMNRPWQYPYGISWPGRPAGRFSDGRVSTDFLAPLITSAKIKTYQFITSRTRARSIKHGINFAVGGSGTFPAPLLTSLSGQVAQLEDILTKYPGLYSPSQTVVVIWMSGNDYTSLLLENPNATPADMLARANEIVSRVGESVRKMYTLGFRNFAVANLQPVGCLPMSTGPGSDTACDSSQDPLVEYHNHLLALETEDWQASLPDLRCLQLNMNKAFYFIIQNPSLFGFKHGLGSCCKGNPPGVYCGDVDAQGNPLHTICPSPPEYFFWDSFHPGNDGWSALSSLLYYGFNFTIGAPNLVYWLNSANLDKHRHSGIGKLSTAAASALALEALSKSGDLDPIELADIISTLSKLPVDILADVGPVTVFLPALDGAAGQQLKSVLSRAPELAWEVALQQVVRGAWPAWRLLERAAGRELHLSTLAGGSITVTVRSGTLFLRPGREDAEVSVVQPSLVSTLNVVVHGTSALLLHDGFDPDV